MSYIDETYGKQLEEALRGLVSRPALGQPWFGFHESEVPAGVLLFTATTHSRVLYADFWKYIQDKNLVKTEEEWQSIYSEQGWCPFYSDGDGIDTFRMPSAPLYLHGANTLSEAGKYVEAGLPNIRATGSPSTLSLATDLQSYPDGPIHYQIGGTYSRGTAEATTNWYYYTDFDASRSSPVYGNSNTVTPKTSKMLFGVWAISAPQQPIPDATVEGIISELGVASNNALEAKNGLDGVVRSVNDVVPNAAGNVDIASLASGWGMPSSRHITLPLGASGTRYTAPANGVFYIGGDASSAQGFVIIYGQARNGMTANEGRWDLGASCFCRKDDSVTVMYGNMSSDVELVFVYAEGEEA